MENQEKLNASQVALNKRLQKTIDCSSPKLTDQSYVKSADINNIMKKYSQTGVLPETKAHLAQYIDSSELPSLEEAHAMVVEAQHMFMGLPAEVRKLMDNDPTKMADYVADPKNKDILVKYGILEENKEVITKSTKVKQEVEPSIPKPENE